MAKKKSSEALDLAPADIAATAEALDEALTQPDPSTCGASKGDKACTLRPGHVGYHCHVPPAGHIDALLNWA